jgi:hypothetical protein
VPAIFERCDNPFILLTQMSPVKSVKMRVSSLEGFPPAETPSPTVDATIPTPTATPIICRAVVENTSFGLYLRDAPSGEEVDLLPEGSVVTLLEDEAVEANGFTWRKVRAVGGDEGWVAQDFLTIGSTCGGQ